jgi:hypothetical protein
VIDTPPFSPPCAGTLIRTLEACGQACDPRTAERLAHEIAACGGLDAAASALAVDEATGLLSRLLALRAALEEQDDPDRRIRRLRLQAQDLDAKAEPLWRQAAEFAGKAAARRLRGEAELAAGFEARVVAAERLAAELEAQAFALRLQAGRLEASSQRRHRLLAAMAGLAA